MKKLIISSLVFMVSTSLNAMENNGKNPVYSDDEETTSHHDSTKDCTESPLFASILNIPKVINPNLEPVKQLILLIRRKTFEILARFSGVRLQHKMNLESIAFNPDSTRLATCQQYGPTFIFDTKTYACIKKIRGPARLLAWSPDGSSIALGSINDINIIDPQSAQCIQTLANKGYIRKFAWNPAGTHIATIDSNMTVRIFDVKTGEIVHIVNCVLSTGSIYVNSSYINTITWSPDGTLLATAGRNDYNGKNEVCIIDHHTNKIFHHVGMKSIDFCTRASDKEQLAALCNREDQIKILTMQELKAFKANTEYENCCFLAPKIKFDNSGSKIAAASDYRGSISLHEFDTENQQWGITKRYNIPHYESCCWSPCGRYITTGQCCSISLIDTQEKTYSHFESYGCSDDITWNSNGQFAKKNYGRAEIYDIQELDHLREIVRTKVTLDMAELLEALNQTYDDRRAGSTTPHARIHATEKQYKTWQKLQKILPARMSNRLQRFIVHQERDLDGYETAQE